MNYNRYKIKSYTLLLYIGVACLGLLSCEKDNPLILYENEDKNEDKNETKLLFKSGFEGETFISDTQDNYQVIKGTDSESGATWPIKILGSDFSGIHRIQDDNGPAIENYLDRTPNRSGEQTTALFQRVNYDIGVTQTPYQINNIKTNPTELYMSYWMKTDDTSLNAPDKWRALWEFKTKKYNENKGEGFRMIAFMATDLEGKLFWQFQGDKKPTEPIWQIRNRTIPVIRDEWFKVSYYIKWSKGSDGYASMHVNDQLIAEHNGATTANADDMDFIILTQVYGNSHPMHQWVDDIEIWQGLPN